MAADGKVRFVIVPVVVVVEAAAVVVVRSEIDGNIKNAISRIVDWQWFKDHLLHVKNSISLTANMKLLLNLYISTFLVLKLKSMLTLLRSARPPPGGTEATSTCGVVEVGESQTLKPFHTA